MVPVRSQNESGGLMAWVSGNWYQSWISRYWHQSWVSRYWRQWLTHPVLQCMLLGSISFVMDFIMSCNMNKEIPGGLLVEGRLRECDVVHKQHVIGHSQEPYTFRYSRSTATITGIACVPVSANIESPDPEVTEGGMNYNFVSIRLAPVKEGKWECNIVICAKPTQPNRP